MTTTTDELRRKWYGMRKRCLNPNCARWRNYGGKGVTLCPEWMESFEAFRGWALANGFEPGLQIDRIDPNGNYEPANCRFLTAFENSSRATGKPRSFLGERMTTVEAAKRYGIPAGVISMRLFDGWTPDEAVSRPVRRWAEDSKVPYETAEQIRAERQAGMKLVDIAARHGISFSYARRIAIGAYRKPISTDKRTPI